jgi:hypothetical protein
MPAVVRVDPAGIWCMFSDASTVEFSLEDLPCPGLVGDLLTGLAELIHPHGAVDAAGSVNHFVLAIRELVRALAGRGFTGRAADLRRSQLVEYWMSATGPREACTRRMLQAFHTATGDLDGRVAELAAGRNYNPLRYRRPLPPYRESEWDRLTTMCTTIADDAYAAHRRALIAAARGHQPAPGGWDRDDVSWLLARVGPVGSAGFGRLLGCSDQVVRDRGGFLEASTDLFPSLDVVIAYRLLFGVYSGIVPDGIDDLVVDDIDWAGDATILLSYVKGRTAAETLNLPRRAVRLLEQWLAHTALLRGLVGPDARRHLWLGTSRPAGCALAVGTIDRTVIQRWAGRHGLLGDDGRPLKIHRSRIRTTHQSLRDKSSWAGRGRATIDPNHSAHVEGDNYLSATTPSQRQAVDAIVEDAQHDLLRRAHPPLVITDQDAAELARDYPGLIAARGLDDGAIIELLGGARDVFTAACADQLSGLHGPQGKPCPARPWVCLLCPLAVFAPRHAANLLRLKAFFARQWRQMPSAQFMAVFGPYSQRIGQVLDCFDPAVLAEAARGVGDHDDELPLRPEESTR